MFCARLDVLKDDYLQTLTDRDVKWPPKAVRAQMLVHVIAVSGFSERFAEQLRGVVLKFPQKSLAALFELQRPLMGVFQAYRDYWLAHESEMSPDSMPKKALKLQEEVQKRYLHVEYAFEFLASTPLTRLIAYVGAVRDVLLVIGDFLPDESASLKLLARSLSELATFASAPSTPGGGFVAQRSIASLVRSGSFDARTASFDPQHPRAKSPENEKPSPPPTGLRSPDVGVSDDESSGRNSPRSASRFRVRGLLSRSGSMQQHNAMQEQRRASATPEAPATPGRRFRLFGRGSGEKPSPARPAGDESGDDNDDKSDDESASDDSAASLSSPEAAVAAALSAVPRHVAAASASSPRSDDDLSVTSEDRAPSRARTPGLGGAAAAAPDDFSPRSDVSASSSTSSTSGRRRRKRAGSVVVFAESSATAAAPAYLTYDRNAALAERKAIEAQRDDAAGEAAALVSNETIEKAASLRIYFRQHYQDALTYAQQRRARLERVKAQLAQPGLTAHQMAVLYGEHCERETSVLRMRRVRPKLRDFEMLALIGRGGFGEVYLCRQTDTHQVLVIKKVKKATLIERNMVESIRVERQVLKDTKSEWLVRLLYSFQDKNHLYLGMEYVPGGNLSTLLENIDFTEAEARVYAAEMVMAVSELHRLGFIHRDLKPDNFLISSKGHLKLADFGLSKPGAHVDDSALLKGAPIRVHMVDGTYKAIPVEDNTRARDVVNALVTKLRIPDDERQRWFLFVVGTETQSQRALKPDELLMPIVRRWDSVASRFGIESHHFLLRQLGAAPAAAPTGAAATGAATESAASSSSAAAASSASSAAASGAPSAGFSPATAGIGIAARVMFAAALASAPDDARSARLNFRALRNQVRTRRTDNKQLVYSVVGTPYYMAPEVIASDGYTHAVDYWSVGCLIYEMLCGVPPFNGDTPDEVFANIVEHETTLQFPAEDDEVSISATAQRFLRRVLTSADKRYDFRQMRQDEWFAPIDFDRLLELEPPFVPALDSEADTTYFENAVESPAAAPLPDELPLTPRERSHSIAGHTKSANEFGDFLFTRYSTMFRPT